MFQLFIYSIVLLRSGRRKIIYGVLRKHGCSKCFTITVHVNIFNIWEITHVNKTIEINFVSLRCVLKAYHSCR